MQCWPQRLESRPTYIAARPISVVPPSASQFCQGRAVPEFGEAYEFDDKIDGVRGIKVRARSPLQPLLFTKHHLPQQVLMLVEGRSNTRNIIAAVGT